MHTEVGYIAASRSQQKNQSDVAARVEEFIRTRIGNRRRVSLTTATIADPLGVSRSVAYYHVRALVSTGRIESRQAGRHGMILSLEEPPKKPSAPDAGRAGYCPWCGTRVQQAWKFCTGCGKALP